VVSGHDPLCSAHDFGWCICERLKQAREQERSIGWQEGYEAGMVHAQELYGRKLEQAREQMSARRDTWNLPEGVDEPPEEIPDCPSIPCCGHVP
jgi:hypothetical protein